MRSTARALSLRHPLGSVVALTLLASVPCWAQSAASPSSSASSSSAPSSSASSESAPLAPSASSSSIDIHASAPATSPDPTTATPPPAQPSAVATSAPPVAPSSSSPPPAPLTRADTFAKIGILGGSVALFAGLLVVTDAQAKAGRLDGSCIARSSSPTSDCARDQKSAIDDYNRENLIGGIVTLTGTLMLGVGIAIYYFAVPDRKNNVSLQIAPGGIRGRF